MRDAVVHKRPRNITKRKKSRAELEAIVLVELRQTLGDISSVTVVGSKHDGVTWKVGSYTAGHSLFVDCERALKTIVPRLQAVYDLTSD
jgi:hypothetical protein